MNKSRFLPHVLALLLSAAGPVFSQLKLNSASPSAVIDFESTIGGVGAGVFTSAGLMQFPAAGQLDSDAWEVIGFSDGPLLFGGAAIAGDLARGITNGGGVGTGGLYALDSVPAAGLSALSFQPGGSDFTPGTITLRLENDDTARGLVSIGISYDILARNDAGRSTSLNFSYSTDNVSFSAVPSLDFATAAPASAAPSFIKIGGPGPSRSTVISGLNVPANGGAIYLRWESDDVGGSGSRDEIAIDNISLTAQFMPVTAALASITGRVLEENGRALRSVSIILSSDAAAAPLAATSNSFGYFRFEGLEVGRSYVLRAVSGKYTFSSDTLVVNLQNDVSNVVFRGSVPTGFVKSF